MTLKGPNKEKRKARRDTNHRTKTKEVGAKSRRQEEWKNQHGMRITIYKLFIQALPLL